MTDDASALPLDVERLAKVLQNSTTEAFGPISDDFWLRQAEALAAEYARLGESGSPTPNPKHANHLAMNVRRVGCPQCFGPAPPGEERRTVDVFPHPNAPPGEER